MEKKAAAAPRAVRPENLLNVLATSGNFIISSLDAFLVQF